MRIPVYSSTIRRSEMDAVLTCMVEEKIGPGEVNQKLIKLVQETYGAEGAFAFRSPTIALRYVLSCFELPENALVMLSALAPSWQYIEVVRMGFEPLVLDVEQASGLVSVQAVEEGIKKGGRILILHETHGNFADAEALIALPIPVIEDISQSAGGVYQERRVGTFGSFTLLGLEERDIITAGGGAILFSCDKKNAAILKNHVERAPTTDFLPDINAALAAVQLKTADKNTRLRSEIYELYMRSLLQTRHKTLSFADQYQHPLYSFPVILESGLKDVKQYVNRKDIDIELAFSNSIAAFLEDKNTCTVAASLLLRTVLFPLYPRLGAKNAAKIAKVLGTLP